MFPVGPASELTQAATLGILLGVIYIVQSWASRSEQEEGIEGEHAPLPEQTDLTLSGVCFASIQVQ